MQVEIILKLRFHCNVLAYVLKPFSTFYLIEFIPNVDCNCDTEGSVGINCDYYGKCSCEIGNVIGDKCNSCAEGFYGFPDCTQGRF